MNSTIINKLTSLKTASLSKKQKLLLKYDTIIISIIKTLYKEGVINSFHESKNNNTITIFLKYSADGKGLFDQLKIISKPSFSKPLTYLEICDILEKTKILIFSTNSGILNLSECKKKKIGGQLFFSI